MRHIFLVFVTALLLGNALPAHAAVGKIFPPLGQSSGSCSQDKVLTWTGKDVKCANPSEGFSPLACPPGQAYSMIQNGTRECVELAFPTITCAEGSAVQKIVDGAPICVRVTVAAITTVSCGAGKVIQEIHGNAAICADVKTGDTTTVSCAAGRVIQKIVNGTATCVDAGEASSTLTAACPSGQALQKIENNIPYCSIIPSSSTGTNIAFSCPGWQTLLGFDAAGAPVCADHRSWLAGQFVVNGTSASSPCSVVNPATNGCSCPTGSSPFKSWNFGSSSQFTCYRVL